MYAYIPIVFWMMLNIFLRPVSEFQWPRQETEGQSCLVTELRDGSASWLSNPNNLEDRNSLAKLLFQAECKDAERRNRKFFWWFGEQDTFFWMLFAELLMTCMIMYDYTSWLANVDAAPKDGVLVPDVKAFQKSLHLDAGAFHVLLSQASPSPVPDGAGDNKQYAKAIFKHIAVKEMSGKWGGSIKQRSTSSWLDRIRHWHLGWLQDAWHPKNPRDILRNNHKSQSHITTGRGFSIVPFETFQAGACEISVVGGHRSACIQVEKQWLVWFQHISILQNQIIDGPHEHEISLSEGPLASPCLAVPHIAVYVLYMYIYHIDRRTFLRVIWV